MRKTDRRVEKTRKLIIDAFTDLILENDFKKITIKSIAEKANINRKTFYLHYSSIDDILFDFSLDLTDTILDELVKNDFFKTQGEEFSLDILIRVISNIVLKNYDLAKKLIINDSYHFFTREIKDLVKETFIIRLKNRVSLSEYKMNIIGDFIASGFGKLLKDWFIDPGDLSIEDIARLASSLIYQGLRGINNDI